VISAKITEIQLAIHLVRIHIQLNYGCLCEGQAAACSNLDELVQPSPLCCKNGDCTTLQSHVNVYANCPENNTFQVIQLSVTGGRELQINCILN
jgi:hypothetical protein